MENLLLPQLCSLEPLHNSVPHSLALLVSGIDAQQNRLDFLENHYNIHFLYHGAVPV
jgi:hypothetical protein